MTYVPNTGAIVKGHKKGEVGKSKNSVVDKVLDSVARVAADADKKAAQISKNSEEKMEKANVILKEKVTALEGRLAAQEAERKSLREDIVMLVKESHNSLRKKVLDLDQNVATKKEVKEKEKDMLSVFNEAHERLESVVAHQNNRAAKMMEWAASDPNKIAYRMLDVEKAVRAKPKLPRYLKWILVSQVIFNVLAVTYILFGWM